MSETVAYNTSERMAALTNHYINTVENYQEILNYFVIAISYFSTCYNLFCLFQVGIKLTIWEGTSRRQSFGRYTVLPYCDSRQKILMPTLLKLSLYAPTLLRIDGGV